MKKLGLMGLALAAFWMVSNSAYALTYQDKMYLQATNPDGYHETVSSAVSSGATTLSSTAVPAGKLLNVTNIAYTATIQNGLSYEFEGGDVAFAADTAQTTGETDRLETNIWLDAGEDIDINVSGTATTDGTTPSIHVQGVMYDK